LDTYSDWAFDLVNGRKTFVAKRRARRKRLKTAIVGDVRKGMHCIEAALKRGVSIGTLWQWQFHDPAFQARLTSARAETVRRIKRTVMAALRAGKTLKEAAALAGRTTSAIHTWRREDAEFAAKLAAILTQLRKRKTARRKSRKKSS
jgi:transposase